MTGAFETGIYRNVFKECGYTEAEIEQRVEDTFRRIFHGTKEECFYHEVGEDMAYVEDTGNHDVRTEGMSYGMMVCVQLDRKEENVHTEKVIHIFLSDEDSISFS